MAFPLIHASCACDRIQSHDDSTFAKWRRSKPQKDLSDKYERPPAHMNILLLKSGIGRARPPVYDLPGPDHIYGCTVGLRATHADAERRAGEVAVDLPSLWRKQTEKLPTDFVKLNKAAAKDGVVTSTQTMEYRKAHPHLVRLANGTKVAAIGVDGTKRTIVAGQALIQLKSKSRLPSDSNPTFVYGKPTRPSTPVARLVSGVYAQQEEGEPQEAARKIAKGKKSRRPKAAAKVVKPPRAPKKLENPEEGPAPLFKMKRFAHVGPLVVTRRPKRAPPGDGGDITPSTAARPSQSEASAAKGDLAAAANFTAIVDSGRRPAKEPQAPTKTGSQEKDRPSPVAASAKGSSADTACRDAPNSSTNNERQRVDSV